MRIRILGGPIPKQERFTIDVDPKMSFRFMFPLIRAQWEQRTALLPIASAVGEQEGSRGKPLTEEYYSMIELEEATDREGKPTVRTVRPLNLDQTPDAMGMSFCALMLRAIPDQSLQANNGSTSSSSATVRVIGGPILKSDRVTLPITDAAQLASQLMELIAQQVSPTTAVTLPVTCDHYELWELKTDTLQSLNSSGQPKTSAVRRFDPFDPVDLKALEYPVLLLRAKPLRKDAAMDAASVDPQHSSSSPVVFSSSTGTSNTSVVVSTSEIFQTNDSIEHLPQAGLASPPPRSTSILRSVASAILGARRVSSILGEATDDERKNIMPSSRANQPVTSGSPTSVRDVISVPQPPIQPIVQTKSRGFGAFLSDVTFTISVHFYAVSLTDRLSSTVADSAKPTRLATCALNVTPHMTLAGMLKLLRMQSVPSDVVTDAMSENRCSFFATEPELFSDASVGCGMTATPTSLGLCKPELFVLCRSAMDTTDCTAEESSSFLSPSIDDNYSPTSRLRVVSLVEPKGESTSSTFDASADPSPVGAQSQTPSAFAMSFKLRKQLKCDPLVQEIVKLFQTYPGSTFEHSAAVVRRIEQFERRGKLQDILPLARQVFDPSRVEPDVSETSRVAHLRQQLRGIFVVLSVHPIASQTILGTRGSDALVDQMCHSRVTKAEASEALFQTINQVQNIALGLIQVVRVEEPAARNTCLCNELLEREKLQWKIIRNMQKLHFSQVQMDRIVFGEACNRQVLTTEETTSYATIAEACQREAISLHESSHSFFLSCGEVQAREEVSRNAAYGDSCEDLFHMQDTFEQGVHYIQQKHFFGTVVTGVYREEHTQRTKIFAEWFGSSGYYRIYFEQFIARKHILAADGLWWEALPLLRRHAEHQDRIVSLHVKPFLRSAAETQRELFYQWEDDRRSLLRNTATVEYQKIIAGFLQWIHEREELRKQLDQMDVFKEERLTRKILEDEEEMDAQLKFDVIEDSLMVQWARALDQRKIIDKETAKRNMWEQRNDALRAVWRSMLAMDISQTSLTRRLIKEEWRHREVLSFFGAEVMQRLHVLKEEVEEWNSLRRLKSEFVYRIRSHVEFQLAQQQRVDLMDAERADRSRVEEQWLHPVPLWSVCLDIAILEDTWRSILSSSELNARRHLSLQHVEMKDRHSLHMDHAQSLGAMKELWLSSIVELESKLRKQREQYERLKLKESSRTARVMGGPIPKTERCSVEYLITDTSEDVKRKIQRQIKQQWIEDFRRVHKSPAGGPVFPWALSTSPTGGDALLHPSQTFCDITVATIYLVDTHSSDGTRRESLRTAVMTSSSHIPKETPAPAATAVSPTPPAANRKQSLTTSSPKKSSIAVGTAVPTADSPVASFTFRLTGELPPRCPKSIELSRADRIAACVYAIVSSHRPGSMIEGNSGQLQVFPAALIEGKPTVIGKKLDDNDTVQSRKLFGGTLFVRRDTARASVERQHPGNVLPVEGLSGPVSIRNVDALPTMPPAFIPSPNALEPNAVDALQKSLPERGSPVNSSLERRSIEDSINAEPVGVEDLLGTDEQSPVIGEAADEKDTQENEYAPSIAEPDFVHPESLISGFGEVIQQEQLIHNDDEIADSPCTDLPTHHACYQEIQDLSQRPATPHMEDDDVLMDAPWYKTSGRISSHQFPADEVLHELVSPVVESAAANEDDEAASGVALALQETKSSGITTPQPAPTPVDMPQTEVAPELTDNNPLSEGNPLPILDNSEDKSTSSSPQVMPVKITLMSIRIVGFAIDPKTWFTIDVEKELPVLELFSVVQREIKLRMGTDISSDECELFMLMKQPSRDGNVDPPKPTLKRPKARTSVLACGTTTFALRKKSSDTSKGVPQVSTPPVSHLRNSASGIPEPPPPTVTETNEETRAPPPALANDETSAQLLATPPQNPQMRDKFTPLSMSLVPSSPELDLSHINRIDPTSVEEELYDVSDMPVATLHVRSDVDALDALQLVLCPSLDASIGNLMSKLCNCLSNTNGHECKDLSVDDLWTRFAVEIQVGDSSPTHVSEDDVLQSMFSLIHISSTSAVSGSLWLRRKKAASESITHDSEGEAIAPEDRHRSQSIFQRLRTVFFGAASIKDAGSVQLGTDAEEPSNNLPMMDSGSTPAPHHPTSPSPPLDNTQAQLCTIRVLGGPIAPSRKLVVSVLSSEPVDTIFARCRESLVLAGAPPEEALHLTSEFYTLHLVQRVDGGRGKADTKPLPVHSTLHACSMVKGNHVLQLRGIASKLLMPGGEMLPSTHHTASPAMQIRVVGGPIPKSKRVSILLPDANLTYGYWFPLISAAVTAAVPGCPSITPEAYDLFEVLLGDAGSKAKVGKQISLDHTWLSEPLGTMVVSVKAKEHRPTLTASSPEYSTTLGDIVALDEGFSSSLALGSPSSVTKAERSVSFSTPTPASVASPPSLPSAASPSNSRLRVRVIGPGISPAARIFVDLYPWMTFANTFVLTNQSLSEHGLPTIENLDEDHYQMWSARPDANGVLQPDRRLSEHDEVQCNCGVKLIMLSLQPDLLGSTLNSVVPPNSLAASPSKALTSASSPLTSSSSIKRPRAFPIRVVGRPIPSESRVIVEVLPSTRFADMYSMIQEAIVRTVGAAEEITADTFTLVEVESVGGRYKRKQVLELNSTPFLSDFGTTMSLIQLERKATLTNAASLVVDVFTPKRASRSHGSSSPPFRFDDHRLSSFESDFVQSIVLTDSMNSDTSRRIEPLADLDAPALPPSEGAVDFAPNPTRTLSIDPFTVDVDLDQHNHVAGQVRWDDDEEEHRVAVQTSVAPLPPAQRQMVVQSSIPSSAMDVLPIAPPPHVVDDGDFEPMVAEEDDDEEDARFLESMGAAPHSVTTPSPGTTQHRLRFPDARQSPAKEKTSKFTVVDDVDVGDVLSVDYRERYEDTGRMASPHSGHRMVGSPYQNLRHRITTDVAGSLEASPRRRLVEADTNDDNVAAVTALPSADVVEVSRVEELRPAEVIAEQFVVKRNVRPIEDIIADDDGTEESLLTFQASLAQKQSHRPVKEKKKSSESLSSYQLPPSLEGVEEQQRVLMRLEKELANSLPQVKSVGAAKAPMTGFVQPRGSVSLPPPLQPRSSSIVAQVRQAVNEYPDSRQTIGRTPVDAHPNVMSWMTHVDSPYASPKKVPSGKLAPLSEKNVSTVPGSVSTSVDQMTSRSSLDSTDARQRLAALLGMSQRQSKVSFAEALRGPNKK